jgi:hypothetical protein
MARAALNLLLLGQAGCSTAPPCVSSSDFEKLQQRVFQLESKLAGQTGRKETDITFEPPGGNQKNPRLAALLSQRQQLLKHYTRNHPEVRVLDTQILDLLQ